MVSGSCLCRKVRYEIAGELTFAGHCHCVTCRKAHGSAFSSVAAVQIPEMKFLSGEDLLKSYESSPGKKRYFCSNCGSQIYAHRENQGHYILRLGTLDDDPGIKPAYHIWLKQKAAWYDLDNDNQLPRFETWSDER